MTIDTWWDGKRGTNSAVDQFGGLLREIYINSLSGKRIDIYNGTMPVTAEGWTSAGETDTLLGRFEPVTLSPSGTTSIFLLNPINITAETFGGGPLTADWGVMYDVADEDLAFMSEAGSLGTGFVFIIDNGSGSNSITSGGTIILDDVKITFSTTLPL